MGCLGIIFILLGLLIVDFLFTSGIVWLVCFAFGLAFSWKIALGIWAIVALLHSIFTVNVHTKKD